MKRNKHSLSHYKLLTGDMGTLMPMTWFEVLPGDTVQQATSLLVRVSPLLAPVMHPVSCRIHHWFVPNRLLWDGWEDFITGGPDGMNNDVPPIIALDVNNNVKGKLLDYLGIPPASTGNVVSALPVRAYNLIYNEYYRDADLMGEATQDQTELLRCAWEKDMFTTARPWPQKGPDVTLPLGISAPVNVSTVKSLDGSLTWGGLSVQGSPPTGGGWLSGQLGTSPATGSGAIASRIDGTADLTNATAVNINDVRKAFALQRYQEARAQYGSRYTEYLRFLGVKSSDARLQRPEYLGGGKQTISFSEVLRTGSESTAPIGQMYGHGIAAARSRRYRRYFEEHGIVMSLLSVRPRSIYTQGAHRGWFRITKEDYWQRELELIGQQHVRNGEIYLADSAVSDQPFGYNDRYYEYRHLPSGVAGDFRDTLNFWHMGREFTGLPTLNTSFVVCDPTKRILAEQTTHSLWIMSNHSIQARRMLGHRTIGRVM